MSADREELIRQRAYALWESDGGRHGLHDDHWAKATEEIDSKSVTTKPAKAKKRTANGGPSQISVSAAQDVAVTKPSAPLPRRAAKVGPATPILPIKATVTPKAELRGTSSRPAKSVDKPARGKRG